MTPEHAAAAFLIACAAVIAFPQPIARWWAVTNARTDALLTEDNRPLPRRDTDWRGVSDAVKQARADIEAERRHFDEWEAEVSR